ncbi:MAG TPA: iron-containing alcohol dehydrogenase, partial [Stellaceae bacterium]|nr:iron-containing alcohol dehydrogenase [Stellaceae bacterium]
MIGFGIARAPATILFGAGQRRALGRVARLTGGRALICTDARFSATEDFSDIVMNLRDAGIATLVYDGTQAELPVENVHNCVALARGFRPDMVVGIGGGSCLDLAKLASLLLSYPGDLADYYGELKVPGPVLPVLALPTTSGTGSECTPVAVVGDSARALKVGVSSPHLVPHAAICDPELTLSCPPILTAITGADAMTHAVEAFTNLARPSEPDLGIDRVFVGKNRISDTYALAAIAELAGHLVVAVEQGEDLEARAGVMLGAMYAGLAFGTAGTAA